MGREIDRQVRGVDTRRAGQRAGEGYTSGFGGAAKKLTLMLGGAFAAVKVGSFAKDAINQASDLNEEATKTQVVFGDASKAIEKFAAGGAKKLGMTGLEATRAAANFGVFGKSAGLAGKENAEFSTGMASLAVDMASFSNTTPEEAIEALGAGLRGESEPLRRFGVLLDDASLRTEAVKQGLIATTKQALTPQQKVLASHALILKQTTDAQGDFARTSGGLANQQRILSAQWSDMKGKLGQAFLPVVTSTISALNDKLFPTLDSLGTKATDAWKILATGDFTGDMRASLGDEDSPLVSALFHARDTFAAVRGGIKEAWNILAHADFKGGNGIMEDSPLVSMLFKVREWGIGVFEKFKGVFANLKDAAIALAPAILSIVASLAAASASAGMSGLDIFATVAETLSGTLTTLLVPAMNAIAGFMEDNPGIVTAAAIAYGLYQAAVYSAAIATSVMSAKTIVMNAATKAWAVISKAWAVATGAMTIAQLGLNTAMKANIIGIVVVALAAIVAGLIYAYNNVEGFRNIVDTAWQSIKDATMSLWEGVLKPAFTWISENIHYVGDAAMWLWNNAMKPAFDGIMAVAAPVFEFLKNSVANAITVFKGIIEFFKGVFTGDFSAAWSGIKTIFSGIWDQIKNILSSAVKVIVTWITEMGPRVLGILGSFLGFMVAKGVEFLGWLWTGIKNKGVELFSWFLSLPGWIWGKIFAAAGWITARGVEFLGFLWTGIKAKGVELFNWFKSLPGWVWDRIVAAKNAVVGYGQSFINWVQGGIVKGAENIWTWVKELPGKVFGFIKGLAGSIAEIGKKFVGWIVEGITSVASTIWDAITGALSGDDEKVKVADGQLSAQASGGNFSSGGVISRGKKIALFSGGILPGQDPGRRDNLQGVLPDGTVFGLRSGEPVMVPEFGRAVGGERGVHALNRLAEAGRLGEVLGMQGGFAAGGILGTKSTAEKYGIGQAWARAKELVATIRAGAPAGANSNGQWGPGVSGGFAANTQAAKEYIEAHFKGVSSIGGLYGGSVPGSDHPMGKALDVMIANYASQQGIAAGTSIADWFIKNPNSFGTKYVIWRDRINQDGQWAGYSHPSGNNDTYAHRDHVHLSFLTGGGAFAPGAAAPKGDAAPGVGAGIASLAASVSAKLGFGMSAGGPGGSPTLNLPPGSGVQRWWPLMSKVIHEKLGADQRNFGAILTVMSNQMMHESSGDPNIMNMTDSNAQAGHPSGGLLQFIPSTFADWADPGFNKNYMDPESQMRAFMNYVPGRYGAGMAGYNYLTSIGYTAYDSGGIFNPGTVGVNLLNKPEAVLTPKETTAYQSHAAALADGYNGSVVINIDNSDPLQVAVKQMISSGVDRGFTEFASDVRRGRLQTV